MKCLAHELASLHSDLLLLALRRDLLATYDNSTSKVLRHSCVIKSQVFMRSTKVPEQTLHRSVSKIYLSAVVSELILGNRRAAAECRIAKLFPRLCRQMNIYEGTTQEKNAAHRNPLTHVVFCAACDSLFKGIVNQGGGG